MPDEQKSYYSDETRELLAVRFGAEALPLLEAAAWFLKDLNAHPVDTIERCDRHKCMATRMRTITVSGQLVWQDVRFSNYGGEDSKCGQGDHDWCKLVRKSSY